MDTNPRDCNLLQHLPDYNTWVKISRKTTCCGESSCFDQTKLFAQNIPEPRRASRLKFHKLNIVDQDVGGVVDEHLQPPTSFPLVSGLKSRTIAILGPTALDNALKPQFTFRLNGYRAIGTVPSSGEDGVFRRPPQSFNENEVMLQQQLVHAVAEADRQDLLAVLGTKFSGNLAKDMGFLDQATGSDFGTNHVAHRNDGDLGCAQNSSKFTLP